jgi:hypothetical protein
LPVQRDVLIAEPLEALPRKRIVDAFGFLQAQHVGPMAFKEFGDEIDAQPHRVDVPGCEGKTHGDSYDRHCEERKRRSNPANKKFWIASRSLATT